MCVIGSNNLLHTISAFLTSDSALTIYKILSPVGAAISAFVGLATDFKDKETGKITRGGYFVCVGVVLSATLGVWASSVEQANSDAAAKRQAWELYQVRRMALLVDQPEIDLDYQFSRQQQEALVRRYRLKTDQLGVPTKASLNQLLRRAHLSVSVEFALNGSPRLTNPNTMQPASEQWVFTIRQAMAGEDDENPPHKSFEYHGVKPLRTSDGAMRSWLDIEGKNVIVGCTDRLGLCDLGPLNYLQIQDANGITVYMEEKDCMPRIMNGEKIDDICRIPSNFLNDAVIIKK